MKNSEIRELTDKEIVEKIISEKDNYTRMKINHKISDLENPHELSNIKKVIARLKTEQKQRENKSQN